MGRTLSWGESFAWEGEFLRVAVPDQAALCFFGWFLVFSSDAFGTLARMISGNAGTWNSCPFLPPSVQTEASRVCPQTQRWAPVSGGPPRPGRISDPTQLFFQTGGGCRGLLSGSQLCLGLSEAVCLDPQWLPQCPGDWWDWGFMCHPQAAGILFLWFKSHTLSPRSLSVRPFYFF